jgi:hypothetical protein
MLALSFIAVALLVAKAAATIYYAGVAESGGEFGVYSRSKISCVPNGRLLRNGRQHSNSWHWASRGIRSDLSVY